MMTEMFPFWVESLASLFDTVLFIRHAKAEPKSGVLQDCFRSITPEGVAQCQTARNTWFRQYQNRPAVVVLSDVKRVHECAFHILGHPVDHMLYLPMRELYYGGPNYSRHTQWWNDCFARIGHASPSAYLKSADYSRCHEYFDLFAEVALHTTWAKVINHEQLIRSSDPKPLLVIVGHAISQQVLAILMAEHWPKMSPMDRAMAIQDLLHLQMGEASGFFLSKYGLVICKTPDAE